MTDEKEDGWHPANNNDEEMGYILHIGGKQVALLEGTLIEDGESISGEYKLWLSDDTDGEYFDCAKDRVEAWKKLDEVIRDWPADGYEHLTPKRHALPDSGSQNDGGGDKGVSQDEL